MGQSDSLPVKIKADEDEELELKGYRVHRGRCALACLLVALSLGLFSFLIPHYLLTTSVYYSCYRSTLHITRLAQGYQNVDVLSRMSAPTRYKSSRQGKKTFFLFVCWKNF